VVLDRSASYLPAMAVIGGFFQISREARLDHRRAVDVKPFAKARISTRRERLLEWANCGPQPFVVNVLNRAWLNGFEECYRYRSSRHFEVILLFLS
jgi:hypothetical protein